jgi:4-carboxymuconolactone decarboxylase
MFGVTATIRAGKQRKRPAVTKLARRRVALAAILSATLSTLAHAQAPALNRAERESGKQQATPAQRLMGDLAPKLAELTDNVLFGDVWERPGLSKRDRSLVTVTALIAMNRPDQLRSHLARARENGLTEEELVEAITHLAFYAGWPSAVTAVPVAREVFKKN